MTTVDERVVEMNFDNKEFLDGVKSTLSGLDALNKGLKLEGATKGLEDVDAAASKFSLSNIENGVSSVADKFKTLSVVGIAALSTITSKAVDAGTRIISGFTDTIKDGLSEYETNLNSIQTILSNTQWEHTNLDDVNKALNELNTYSDKTIYNFTEMANNIGTFTAAGVKLDVATDAIKGIANLAAVSGSNAQQASTAMYQLSQALAAGKVSLEDWNSVVNAGLGGKVFQDALMETARVHGVAIDKMVKDEKGFRNTLQKGWLTSSILTETLDKFTGDLSAKQLKAMGYNDQQIAGIIKMGQTAQDAATKIKTFSQLMSTLQEASGSGWTQTWQLIFGDFDEAKNLFTNVYNVLGGFITASSNARNKVLGDWKELGGRTAIIQSISNVFYALLSILKPIKDAFRDIFPPLTGKQLADFSKSLESFTAKLKIGADTANELKRTFEGVFAIFGIAKDIVVGVVKVILDLIGATTNGSGSILKYAANVGDLIVKLKDWLESGDRLNKFFKGLEAVLGAPIVGLKLLATWLGSVFDGVDNKAEPAVERLQARLKTFGGLGDNIIKIWGGIVDAFNAVKKALTPVVKQIGDFFSALYKDIQSTFSGSGVDFSGLLDAINTGLFAGLVVIIKKFLSHNPLSELGEGFLDTIKEPFEALTGTLEAMQTKLKADALLKIAAAIGLLTVSVVALSLINSDKLTVAVTAMGVMFGELMASMSVFEKTAGSKGIAKLPLVTASLLLLAGAIDLLTIAVKSLSELDWNSLAKGLTGLTVILGELVGFVRLMPNDAKLLGMGVGLTVFAAGVKLLVSAVTDLAGLSWEQMAKGLGGVAALLTSLGLFSKFTDVGKGGLLQDTGLLVMAAAINILANATTTFGKLSWQQIAKGLATMGASLTLIGAALKLLPKDTLASATSVLIVSAAMVVLAEALGKMGDMGWEQIAKGLVVLAGSLIIIGTAMDAMTEALPGAAALLVVAASMAIMVPVLKAMGDMSWEEIGKSMLVLAGVFVVFGAAAAILTPVVPVMVLLGAAVALLGVGVLAAGAGMLLFATALTVLAGAAAAGTAALVFMITQLAGLIPTILTQLGLGLVAFANVVAQSGPAFTGAITTVLLSFITAITTLIPQIVNALLSMLQALLKALLDHVPQMVDMGYKLLTGILTGIANNISKVVTQATNVVVNFLNAIGNNLPRITDAGVKMIISFVNGLATSIRNNTAAMRQAGLNLAEAIIDGMTGGLASGAGKVAEAAKNAAKKAFDAAKNFLDINSPSKKFRSLFVSVGDGAAQGIDRSASGVAKSAVGMSKTAFDAMAKSLSKVPDMVSDNMNVTPSITPVLDLTDLKKNAGQIDRVLAGTKQISTAASFAQALVASNGHPSNLDVPDDGNGQNGSDQRPIQFNQYNTSPKALSAVEIYRQTKNQLSKAKGALQGNAVQV